SCVVSLWAAGEVSSLDSVTAGFSATGADGGVILSAGTENSAGTSKINSCTVAAVSVDAGGADGSSTGTNTTGAGPGAVTAGTGAAGMAAARWLYFCAASA